ncbi:hypothetical protein [Fischerella sp.]|nr:hypothetical protein [Fischerella sp.]
MSENAIATILSVAAISKWRCDRTIWRKQEKAIACWILSAWFNLD